MKLKIQAPARIHIALADVGDASLRAFGGVGFAVEEPRTIVNIEEATTHELVGFAHLDRRGREAVKQVLSSFREQVAQRPCRITLEAAPPQHHGFGSKTSLLLSLVALLSSFYELSLTDQDKIEITRRGGASGIGVHAFFQGGICCDGGHPRNESSLYQPSGATVPTGIPPLLWRRPIPEEWRVALILLDGKPYHSDGEQKFFGDNTPIDKLAAYQTISLIHHGCLPALATDNLDLLHTSLRKLQETGFKKLEISAQPESVRLLIEQLASAGLPCGMSSMGPLVYAIVHRDDDVSLATCRKLSIDFSASSYCVSKACNSGASLTRVVS